jgi:anti-anti-sigma regulatory factor
MNAQASQINMQLPPDWKRDRWKAFCAGIEKLGHTSYQPHLVIDLSQIPEIGQDTIEVLLRCVELVERADGRVSLTGVSPQAAVILEVTRLTSVLDLLTAPPPEFADGHYEIAPASAGNNVEPRPAA